MTPAPAPGSRLEAREESGLGPLPEFVKAEMEGVARCGDYVEPGIMRSRWAKLAVAVHMDPL
jgi:hypothetical protein